MGAGAGVRKTQAGPKSCPRAEDENHQRAGAPLTREELIEKVWGQHYVGESNIVDVYIRRLRRKIERDTTSPTIIQSVRGVGYKFSGT